MDGIGVGADERNWVTGPVSPLGAPNARLMDEQFVNWCKGYRNRGGPQSSQVSATRRRGHRQTYQTIEIDAGKIDAGMGARGHRRLTCFNFG